MNGIMSLVSFIIRPCLVLADSHLILPHKRRISVSMESMLAYCHMEERWIKLQVLIPAVSMEHLLNEGKQPYCYDYLIALQPVSRFQHIINTVRKG